MKNQLNIENLIYSEIYTEKQLLFVFYIKKVINIKLFQSMTTKKLLHFKFISTIYIQLIVISFIKSFVYYCIYVDT